VRGDRGASLRLAAVVSPAYDETEAVRRVYEREAANYDRNVKLPERLLFSGGREWVCAQAGGDVLEIAVGTGRNLRHYPDGVRLTGIEFVPAMSFANRSSTFRPRASRSSCSNAPSSASLNGW
jgi:hypothetical protein